MQNYSFKQNQYCHCKHGGLSEFLFPSRPIFFCRRELHVHFYEEEIRSRDFVLWVLKNKNFLSPRVRARPHNRTPFFSCSRGFISGDGFRFTVLPISVTLKLCNFILKSNGRSGLKSSNCFRLMLLTTFRQIRTVKF